MSRRAEKLPVFNHAPIYTIVLIRGSGVNGRVEVGDVSEDSLVPHNRLIHSFVLPILSTLAGRTIPGGRLRYLRACWHWLGTKSSEETERLYPGVLVRVTGESALHAQAGFSGEPE